MPGKRDDPLARLRVSIHAPRFREAMRSPGARSMVASGFQSTPPVSGRRCQITRRKCRRVCGFNPRPPFPGGDARDMMRLISHSSRFNPRPPFPGGDAEQSRQPEQQSEVSIHAPRFREAMLVYVGGTRFHLGFQSTPPVSGRRCPTFSTGRRSAKRFQSTPPVSGRRCEGKQGAFLGGGHLFQSTPPVSGRRCKEGEKLSHTPTQFQSTPPVSGRRCPSRRAEAEAVLMFQSTPPVSGRRCGGRALGAVR